MKTETKAKARKKRITRLEPHDRAELEAEVRRFDEVVAECLPDRGAVVGYLMACVLKEAADDSGYTRDMLAQPGERHRRIDEAYGALFRAFNGKIGWYSEDRAEGEVFNTPARQRSVIRFIEGLVAGLGQG